MSIEARFLRTLIRKAKVRLIHQAKIVGELPANEASHEAVQACDTLRVLNNRVAYLCLERARLKTMLYGFGSG